MQPLDLHLGESAFENVQHLSPAGTVTAATGSPFPHIVVGSGGSRWTSACLPLVKVS
jgi:hypothetical protein